MASRTKYLPPPSWPLYGVHEHTWEAVDAWHEAVGDYWFYMCTECKDMMDIR